MAAIRTAVGTVLVLVPISAVGVFVAIALIELPAVRLVAGITLVGALMFSGGMCLLDQKDE